MILREMVGKGKKVEFIFYEDEALWYKTDCGFEFPVTIGDAYGARFLKEDRAILFMKHIQKHLKFLDEARKLQEREVIKC